MPRKNAPAAQTHDDADTKALEKGTKALARVSQDAAEVAAMIGYDLPYNKDRVIQETRFFMSQSAEAMLEAGKRLILLKENEDHGAFLQIVDEQFGMEARVAQKMMQAAAKYLTNPQLAGKANTFSLLGKSKLYEMMVMDDDDLEAIASGGTVNGLNLDEIDRMTTRELKAALRESVATATATEKVLATKNKKIDQVTAQLERKKAETDPLEWKWGPNRKALLDTGENIVNFAQTELRRAFLDIREMADSEGGVPEDLDALQGQVLSAIMQTFVVIQNDYGITVDLESIVVPAWSQPESNSKKK